MKKVILATLLIGCSFLSGYAQRISRVSAGMDVGVGFGDGQLGPSLLYFQTIQPPKMPWLQINGGFRVWNYFTKATDLTAPGGAGRDDIMELDRVSATGASFVLGANVRVANAVDIGVNADVLGFAFGKRRAAVYRLASPSTASDTLSPLLNGKRVDIAPANLNVLPAFVKKNNGQAEAFIRIWLGKQVGIKASYVIGQVSYRTDVKLNNGQKRYSSMYYMPYLALSFPLYN